MTTNSPHLEAAVNAQLELWDKPDKATFQEVVRGNIIAFLESVRDSIEIAGVAEAIRDSSHPAFLNTWMEQKKAAKAAIQQLIKMTED